MGLKGIVLIDGNWFYHSRQALFNLKNEDGFELDYARIPSLIADWLSDAFKEEVEVIKCLYFGVVHINKVNCNSSRQVAFYNFLSKDCNFDVITSELDYKSEFSISEERAIGLALAASLMKNLNGADSFDIAAFVCGSADYIPLIQQVNNVGKKTAIITMHNQKEMQNSSEMLYKDNVTSLLKPIFIDNHVDELRLIRKEQVRICKSCGNEETTTWAGPEFYCSKCRFGYQRKRF